MKLARFNQFVAHHWAGGMSADDLFNELAAFSEEEKKDMAEILAVLVHSGAMEQIEKGIDDSRAKPPRVAKRRK